jgi:hypothetical protein
MAFTSTMRVVVAIVLESVDDDMSDPIDTISLIERMVAEPTYSKYNVAY